MSALKEVCICGHDIATHFLDPLTRKRGACLGMHCDDCLKYLAPPGVREPKARITTHVEVEEDDTHSWSGFGFSGGSD